MWDCKELDVSSGKWKLILTFQDLREAADNVEWELEDMI
jgi:hypothetical protein